MDPIFFGTILKKYSVQYYRCSSCEYVCTENPYWLSESYKNSINVTDTGIISRNIHASKTVSCIFVLFFNKNINGLDYGGGYGILTRLMRDIGFNFFWWDPHTKNLFAQGYEYPQQCKEIDVITAFENFEHYLNPIEDLKTLFSISHNIIFSTDLLPNPVPKPEEWWYYGLEHGQHISFYSRHTLQTIARRFNVQYYSHNNLHFFTSKKINKTLWKLVCKFGSRFIFPIIQLKMRTKTVDDMNFLKISGNM